MVYNTETRKNNKQGSPQFIIEHQAEEIRKDTADPSHLTILER